MSEAEIPPPDECLELARYWRELAGDPPFPLYLECSRAWGRLALIPPTPTTATIAAATPASAAMR